VVKTQLNTFEAMHNIVLTEPVVDCLKRWMWRCKTKMRGKKIIKMQRLGLLSLDKKDYTVANEHHAKGHENSKFGTRKLKYNTHKDSEDYNPHEILIECDDFKDATAPVNETPLDMGDDDILPVWSAKKAGKRPFHVNESYHVEQQLENPLRRMEMYGPRNPVKWAETYGTVLLEDPRKAFLELADPVDTMS
jgi:hypothetical protein